jgi:nucleoside-diphosphate-sugar epimerase
MARILVTGASGFMGKHLVPRLREAGHEVFEADIGSGDVAEETTWLKYPRSDAVIHLAGKTFVPDSWSDPAGFMRCNLLGTVAALNHCRRNNARLVFLSSTIGNPQRFPFRAAPLVVNNLTACRKTGEEACVFSTFGIHHDPSPVQCLRSGSAENSDPVDHSPGECRQGHQGQDLDPKRIMSM